MRKLTYDHVKSVFKDGECELLSKEYRSAHQKLKYKCLCGNISEISFNSFKQGHRCMKCHHERLSIKFRYDIDYVRSYFKKEGCILLSKEYKNSRLKLDFICDCGNYSVITFSKFTQGQRCKKCGQDKIKEKLKHSYEYVKEYFNKNNCKLVSREYVNDATKLDYICVCGNDSQITFNSFQQGTRCNECGVERTRGENSVHWNPNLTDEERILKRDFPEYREWRTEVYKKDDYTCHKCSQRGGNLNAHHIENYATNKKLRLDKSNGTTLCKDCHIKFHKKYGKKDNNKQQLDEFLKVYSLCLK